MFILVLTTIDYTLILKSQMEKTYDDKDSGDIDASIVQPI
jgi:hypothetical protein